MLVRANHQEMRDYFVRRRHEPGVRELIEAHGMQAERREHLAARFLVALDAVQDFNVHRVLVFSLRQKDKMKHVASNMLNPMAFCRGLLERQLISSAMR
jgi:hypothetical protein